MYSPVLDRGKSERLKSKSPQCVERGLLSSEEGGTACRNIARIYLLHAHVRALHMPHMKSRCCLLFNVLLAENASPAPVSRMSNSLHGQIQDTVPHVRVKGTFYWPKKEVYLKILPSW